MNIIKANIDQIPDIIDIALQTWSNTYEPILGKEQTDFMFGEIYTPESLLKQMEFLLHSFFILYVDKQPIAFASISQRPENKSIFKLHKLYVLPSHHGNNYGKTLLEFCERECKKSNAEYLELNVNRFNKAKLFYEKMGYQVVRQEDIPFGNYFMNDYVLQKKIHNK